MTANTTGYVPSEASVALIQSTQTLDVTFSGSNFNGYPWWHLSELDSYTYGLANF